MHRFFCDMDGVLADFLGHAKKLGLSPTEMKGLPGVFAEIDPLPGALAGITEIHRLGFDVFIATRPASRHPGSYADKATWIGRHLPFLVKKIVMTQDKGLLGDEGDYLLDDHLDRSNCMQFKGQQLPFTPIDGDTAGCWAAVGWQMAQVAHLTGLRPRHV